MKAAALILLFATCRSFAVDDTNLVAVGEWSEPVANAADFAIRGRLLICDMPAHASSSKPWATNTAVYLELQEFSDAVRGGRVYCGLNRFTLPDDSPGLRCELRDSAGKLVPNSPGGLGGGMTTSYWVTLMPSCSVRALAGGGGRLSDGGLAIYLASKGYWDIHPNPTNDYYLSGTFSAVCPTNEKSYVDFTNRDVWCGTLKLPPVKIPVKKPQ